MSSASLLDRSEETAVQKRASGNQLLDLIQAVVTNPDVSVEKVQALWDMQKQTEERDAEKAFDAALLAAQEEIEGLAWDKFNASNQNHFVSYPKIEKMLKPIRKKYGFTQSYDSEPGPTPDMAFFCCDVIHKGGHRRRYRLPMPIDGSGPKGGGVMTKSQAVGNGTSYSMRYLDKMIWNIPMLVDKDDTDGNEPQSSVNDQQLKELQTLFDKLPEARRKKCLEYFRSSFKQNIDSLRDVPATKYNAAITALTKAITAEAQNELVNESQIASLQCLIDEVGGKCRQEFLSSHKIAKLSDLPAAQYHTALKGLEEKRRAN